MRNILNISLPKEMVADIKRGVKAGKFASTSEFMRHLIRVWNTKNTDEGIKSLLRRRSAPFKKGRIQKGKYKVPKSLTDLR